MTAEKYRITVIIFILGTLFLMVPVSAQNETPTPTPTPTFVPVNIDFTVNTTTGQVPLYVLFTDVTDSPGEVFFREWFFGDGTHNETSSTDIVHKYTSPGIYTVTFDRRDEQGSHVKIKYDYITVNAIPTQTPTTTPTTSPTTAPTTTTPTTSPTTSPPTTTPTTFPTISPTPTIPTPTPTG
ncbi:MAG TPA: PKD domain-containing protein, partial [Methanoregulaceae archaeon]|nr:PKD domain-containing protein [Methanoregulaceae archaeon]